MDSEASSVSGSEQVKNEQKETSLNESELRLAQLQHQLPSNEPGALMHLVENVSVEDEDDEDTRQCKTLFRNMKFFLSREVRSIFDLEIIYSILVCLLHAYRYLRTEHLKYLIRLPG